MLLLSLCALLPALAPLDEGVRALGERRLEEALVRFEAAGREAPADPRPPFFRGATLNRMGRFEEALKALDEAARKGSLRGDLPFERGWSLMGLERYREAIPLLESHAATHPDHGQSSEFLGRCLVESGEPERGEAALKEALRRDPALASTVRIYLAHAQRLRTAQGTEAPAGHLLQEQVNRLTAVPSARPWTIQLSSAVGYNSNVVALGQGYSLAPPITSPGAQYLDLGLDLRGNWRAGSAAVAGGYSFLDRIYDRLSDYNVQDHFAFLSLSGTGAVRPSVRVSHEATLLGGDRFRDLSALRPALAWKHASWGTVEGACTLGLQDYARGNVPAQDRDGDSVEIRLTEFLTLRPGIQLKAAVFQEEQHTEGRDFDVVRKGWQSGFRAALPLKFSLEGSVTRSRDRYDHPNSLSGFTISRKDTEETWRAQLTRPLTEKTELFIEYRFMDQESNLGGYDYHQHQVSGGISLRF